MKFCGSDGTFEELRSSKVNKGDKIHKAKMIPFDRVSYTELVKET